MFDYQSLNFSKDHKYCNIENRDNCKDKASHNSIRANKKDGCNKNYEIFIYSKEGMTGNKYLLIVLNYFLFT